ncbi:hypothetical protein PVK06_028223 [Gossypium arboreum]|uniref:Zinc knuckle CX2CX4HX4C n=1 Tax=Gossypium arboreum TaxID=29729 RepID=A0ABR0P2I6_GOSAR|nr:hypothetical protein PVK06_028223 [Gossypium arboreum]
MTVFVDLHKPLASQVLVNGEIQWVEYKALPTICFLYGKYGHLKEMCHSLSTDKGNDTGKISGNSDLMELMTGGEGPRESKKGFKSGIASNWEDSNIDVGSGILEVGSRPEVAFGKIKEIINQNKHNERKLAVVDLGVNKQLESFSDSSKFSNSSINSNMMIAHFNPTFEESEGALVVLDENLLNLGKYSTVVFKEVRSSEKV